MCLLFFDKLQHIKKSAKSEAEGCLCSLVRLLLSSISFIGWSIIYFNLSFFNGFTLFLSLVSWIEIILNLGK